jgi:O-antigen/teichoic acid export membrane protein
MTSLFSKLKQVISQHKLTRDIAWSMGSFFTLAISGIVINIVVTAFRDAAALGVFNQAYAVYIIISQFAVWGIHYSVLRYAAYFEKAPNKRGRMLFSAGVLALLSGAIFAFLTVLTAPLTTFLFDSADTGVAIQYAALGLILFPLNKVLLAYLNGMREIKAFSILQGMRYFLVMLFVSIVVATSLPIEYATLAFFFAEVFTTLGLIIFLWQRQHHIYLAYSNMWVLKHLKFGTKGLAGGMFAEVNSRVDVLLIGIFLSDRATGIYSFAAMLVDGLYHILAMVRINFNPLLVVAVRDKAWTQAKHLRSQLGKIILPIIFILSIFLVLAYLIFANWIVPGKGLLEGLPSLLILLCGLNMICIFVPLDNLMVVSGHPGYQAAQQIMAVAANSIIAIILLPLFGIEGAALGTATSYLVGISMMIFFTRRLLGWNLISNESPTGT